MTLQLGRFWFFVNRKHNSYTCDQTPDNPYYRGCLLGEKGVVCLRVGRHAKREREEPG